MGDADFIDDSLSIGSKTLKEFLSSMDKFGNLNVLAMFTQIKKSFDAFITKFRNISKTLTASGVREFHWAWYKFYYKTISINEKLSKELSADSRYFDTLKVKQDAGQYLVDVSDILYAIAEKFQPVIFDIRPSEYDGIRNTRNTTMFVNDLKNVEMGEIFKLVTALLDMEIGTPDKFAKVTKIGTAKIETAWELIVLAWGNIDFRNAISVLTKEVDIVLEEVRKSWKNMQEGRVTNVRSEYLKTKKFVLSNAHIFNSIDKLDGINQEQHLLKEQLNEKKDMVNELVEKIRNVYESSNDGVDLEPVSLFEPSSPASSSGKSVAGFEITGPLSSSEDELVSQAIDATTQIEDVIVLRSKILKDFSHVVKDGDMETIRNIITSLNEVIGS